MTERRRRPQPDMPGAFDDGPPPPPRPRKILPPPSPAAEGSNSVQDIAQQQEHEFRDQQEDILETLAERYAPYEGYDLLFSNDGMLNGSIKATFQDGVRLSEVRSDAVKPKIGVTFLMGADTPQVNQMEEASMTQAIPDQKDPSWRFNTASALLLNFSVRKDMTIAFTDITASVIAAHRRRQSSEGPFDNPSASSSKAIALRRSADRYVTIDSDLVQIVNDLTSEKWDLEGLLVEVDQTSLMSLISNYQRIIRRNGSDLPATETIHLLETMIEDARRLCIRSPILFRMSTRRQIVASKNTRYGADDGIMFKTLTTSSGIKNIISLSAAYFNSLPQSSLPANIQSEVRLRFLQMLVLLLSLLNDDDLNELSEFLEVTYGIRADRQHIELLILKVIPLQSINSKIFLKALVAAFDGPRMNPSPHLSDQPVVWNIFVSRMLQQGYILPGTIDQLGCAEGSWVIRWPDQGFKSTEIFRNLQYAGASRTINEIPPVELNPELSSTAELTVVLANSRHYIIASAELENIIRMTPGRYTITEAAQGGRSFTLDINEVCINQTTIRAIALINSMLGVVRGILPSRPRNEIVRRIDNVFRSRSVNGGRPRYDDALLPEIKGCGRLTYHVASINGQQHNIALACKVDGRKISKRELARLLQADINKIDATQRAVEMSLQNTFEGKRIQDNVRETIMKLRRTLSEVTQHIGESERRKNGMLGYDAILSGEPVKKVLYQVGARETQFNVWSSYKAWYQGAENVLYIESYRRIVENVVWQGETMIVKFQGFGVKYFVAPLQAVPDEEKWEELQEGDKVLLCGHYILVVEQSNETFVPTAAMDGTGGNPSGIRVVRELELEGDGNGLRVPRQLRPGPRRGPPMQQQPLHGGEVRLARPSAVPLERVVGWLKIVGMEAGQSRRRGRNREEQAPLVRSLIR